MKNRKRNRMLGFDYSNDAIYFLTICCKKRIHHFGEVIDGKMQHNVFGEIACQQIEWLEKQYPYTIVHNYVVMPNHVHILLEINRNSIAVQNAIGINGIIPPVRTGRDVGTGRDLSVLGDKKNGDSFIHDGNKINGDLPSTFSPIDILDYIYAVLHSPSYREKYKEFLKIDFPRVPYPTDLAVFRNLVSLGSQLRQIHLLESPVVEKYITQYPIDGTNQVEKPKYENGKVWINETQYFANVPETAWNFYIGGYQPAQKWLKDRKDRTLDFEDILHYQKIIVALTETDRIMKVIDEINFE